MMHAWTPEASWKLAGGRASAASEHHRNTTQANIRPGGGGGNPVRAFSSAPSGAHSFLPQYSGGVRFARPPANFRCPSGTLAQTPASLLTAMFHACPKLALMGVPTAVPRVPRGTSNVLLRAFAEGVSCCDDRTTPDDSGETPESAGGTPALPETCRSHFRCAVFAGRHQRKRLASSSRPAA